MTHRMNVGIYGGTFDPPHNAHIKLVRFALKKLALDFLYIIPAKGHALKKNDRITPPEIRFELVKAAFSDQKNVRISRIELDGPDTSYTIETLERFGQYEQLENVNLYYLIGADNLQEIHLWKEPERILELARIVVLRRPGYQAFPAKFPSTDQLLFLDSPRITISSTEIRKRLRHGFTVEDMIPQSVLHLIEQYQLYRKG